MGSKWSSVLVALLLAVAGCADDDGRTEPATTSDGGSEAGGNVDVGPPPPERTCPVPEGVSGSPQTIGETIDLINALPEPTTIPCLIESLERPLDVTLTHSFISAQPAGGIRSPRIFIKSGPLFLSVVPEGEGRPLLEFGEMVGPATSIKGELKFPVNKPLSPSAPFDHILQSDGDGTVCAICHRDEKPYPAIEDAPAYTSAAFAPAWQDRVPLEDLRAEWQACDAEEEPDRCGFLDALFGWGEVREVDFPSQIPTIFE